MSANAVVSSGIHSVKQLQLQQFLLGARVPVGTNGDSAPLDAAPTAGAVKHAGGAASAFSTR